MTETFQKRSKLIDFGNHKAAKHDAVSVDALIVYDMRFHLKSEPIVPSIKFCFPDLFS